MTNSDNATKADYPYAVGEEVADAKPAVVESATVPANTPDNASQDAKDVADQMTGGRRREAGCGAGGRNQGRG